MARMRGARKRKYCSQDGCDNRVVAESVSSMGRERSAAAKTGATIKFNKAESVSSMG